MLKTLAVRRCASSEWTHSRQAPGCIGLRSMLSRSQAVTSRPAGSSRAFSSVSCSEESPVSVLKHRPLPSLVSVFPGRPHGIACHHTGSWLSPQR